MVLTLVITLKVMLLKVLTMTIMVVKIVMVIMIKFIIWSTLPFLNSVLHTLVQVVLNQRMD